MRRESTWITVPLERGRMGPSPVRCQFQLVKANAQFWSTWRPLNRRSRKSADYHDDMIRHAFLEWFTEQALMNIQNNSVIVIDDMPYHRTYKDRVPTSIPGKEKIRIWLVKHGTFSKQEFCTFSKTKLLHLVKSHWTAFTKYNLDELARRYGHAITGCLLITVNLIPLNWFEVT